MASASRIQAGPVAVDQVAHAAGTLLETIEAIVGPASFLDMSFPRASLAGYPAIESTRMLRLPRAEIERKFLRRFRQAGGHMPIADIDLSNEVTWPPHISQERSSVVVCFEDINAAVNAGKYLRESQCSLLCPAPMNGMRNLRRDDGDNKHYHCVRLTNRNAGPAYILLLPQQGQRGSRPASTETPDDVIFDFQDSNVVIEARTMIHDGGYVSEGDIKYSWLWTGPSTHFRLILPQIAGIRPRLAELCVPRTEEEGNLDRLVVQLDGRAIRHRLDRWSATSGKVSIDIPKGVDYAVLTLVVPKSTHDANSGRLLGLCLDKLMLRP